MAGLFYFLSVILVVVGGQNWADTRLVQIDQGPVRGFKFQGDDFFSFYNIPYGTAKHRYQIAAPPPIWTQPFEAVNRYITCPQPQGILLDLSNHTMQEDCLVINIFLSDTNQTNLPVLVDIHGGAFHTGLGDSLKFRQFAVLKNVISVTFNYRVGMLGFLCLGTPNIPGNAGMKDIITALRWVKRNIASFGGNPDDVTLSGCSAGGSAMDLVLVSKAAEGLFSKAMPDSGSNLGAFAVTLDPVAHAKERARMLNFTDVDNIEALEEFFLTTPFQRFIDMPSEARPDTILDYAPCVERDVGQEIIFLHDSPYNILKNGNYTKYPTMYGLTNLEGFATLDHFDKRSAMMNENFADVLPGDLIFENEEQRQEVGQYVRNFFFGNSLVNSDTLFKYLDYYSDAMFVYSILRNIKLQVEAGHDKVYLYEYSYHAEDSTFPGALHCQQAHAIRDENEETLTEEYKSMKAFMREIWYNFMTTGNPSWPPVNQTNRSPHLSVGRQIQLLGPLLEERARFWDDIYERYYRAPIPPILPDTDGASVAATSYILLISLLFIRYLCII